MYPAVGLAALCRVSAAAASLPALDNLVAYWKMDEAASVNRADASGNGHTLAVTGTVNAGVGKINNGAAYVNNSANFLSNNDAAITGLTFPFTAFAWVNISGSLGSNQTILSHFSAVPPSGWRIRLDAANNYQFEIGDGIGGNPQVVIGGPVGIGAYHLVIATFVDATHISGRMDNGADNTAVIVIAMSNPAISFKVGVSDVIPSPLNAVVDEVGIYNRVLTSAEKDALWNAGAGKSCCPFT